jgi:Uma2 family endonuclease
MVVCDSNSQAESFQQSPVLVVEVLSRATRAIDLDEKLNHYLQIASLHYCLYLEQIKPRAILLRRMEGGFLREVYESMEEVILLPVIGCELSLRDIYDRVDFSPESIREELVDYVA